MGRLDRTQRYSERSTSDAYGSDRIQRAVRRYLTISNRPAYRAVRR